MLALPPWNEPKLLEKPIPMETQVTDLIHKLQLAYKRYKHEHTRDTVKELIHLALELQNRGYAIVLFKHKRAVGAIRRQG